MATGGDDAGRSSVVARGRGRPGLEQLPDRPGARRDPIEAGLLGERLRRRGLARGHRACGRDACAGSLQEVAPADGE
jgi:hypothetical protein